MIEVHRDYSKKREEKLERCRDSVDGSRFREREIIERQREDRAGRDRGRSVQGRKRRTAVGAPEDASNRSLPKPLLLVTAREDVHREGETATKVRKRRKEKQAAGHRVWGGQERAEREHRKLSSSSGGPRSLIIRWEWHEELQLGIRFLRNFVIRPRYCACG